eukprot:scaffold139119_cov18-Tisochrysis_lutea.AAC.1
MSGIKAYGGTCNTLPHISAALAGFNQQRFRCRASRQMVYRQHTAAHLCHACRAPSLHVFGCQFPLKTWCRFPTLLCLQGTITNVSDVKPLVTVAAYTDVETGHELYQEVDVNGSVRLQVSMVNGCTSCSV